MPWSDGAARVIGLVPGQIVTDALVEELRVERGEAHADPARDLAKIAVIERHLGTGRIGLGFVRGFGLERGALASTFSHDAHNLVVVGMSDEDMATAAARLAELGGGLVVVDGGAVTAELPLPVAGLLSDRPLAEVTAGSEATVAAVHALGSSVESPFQSMAFLALSVIPSLKLTDRGLVDVDRFELVQLRAGEASQRGTLRDVSWPFIVLLALAVGVVIAAEWQRLGARLVSGRFGSEARRRASANGASRTSSLFAPSRRSSSRASQRDLAELPTTKETRPPLADRETRAQDARVREDPRDVLHVARLLVVRDLEEERVPSAPEAARRARGSGRPRAAPGARDRRRGARSRPGRCPSRASVARTTAAAPPFTVRVRRSSGRAASCRRSRSGT